jgi:hypothetical protein
MCTFDVSCIDTMTDDSLSAMDISCPNSHTTDFKACDSITNNSLLKLTKGCKDLRSFNFSSCRNFNDARRELSKSTYFDIV